MSLPRGRKPLPAALRLVTAGPNDNPDRINQDEPQVTNDIPDAPSWLNKAAQEVWKRTVAEVPAGMLRSLDHEMLVSYCVAVAERDELIIKLNKLRSKVVITKKGNMIQHPYVGMLNRQVLIIAKLGSELGFSPTSRARLKVNGGQKKENPFSDHAAKKRRA